MMDDQFVERLSPLDLLMPGGYVGAVLVFHTTQQSSTILLKLQSELDSVCLRTPWLKGQVFPTSTKEGQAPGLEIRWTAKDTSPQIIDKGILKETYQELYKTQMPLGSIPSDLWPMPGVVQAEAEAGSGVPVLAASLFRFADGKTVGLCIQGHHNTMDGFGFNEIINLWARCMSDSGTLIPGPINSTERTSRLMKGLGKSYDTSGSSPLNVLLEKHPEYSRTPPDMPTEFAVCESEILTIDLKKIQTIKESLKPYLDTLPTTNTVACTLVWSAITRARMRRTQHLDNKTSRLPMAVNGRKRLDVSLTDRQDPYLGNVVLFSLAEMAASDVRACGEEDNAKLLADACRIVAQAQSSDRINAAHISECCSIVEKLGDHRSVFPGWELFGSRDLFITSWADLDIYEFDFGEGLGKPQFVRTPYAQADGNVIILPRKRSTDGLVSEQGLEVVVMLQKEDLEVLKEDGLWKVL